MSVVRPSSIPPEHHAGKGRSKLVNSNTKNPLRFGYCLVEGKANHPMEDYHHAEFRRVNNNLELGLFAIYDGHVSQTVPKFLQSNLFENIIAQV
jgi:protein phosphatase 1L